MEIAIEVQTVFEKEANSGGLQIVSVDREINWALSEEEVELILKSIAEILPPEPKGDGPILFEQLLKKADQNRILYSYETAESPWSFFWAEASEPGYYELFWNEHDSFWGIAGSKQSFSRFLAFLEKGLLYLTDYPPRDISSIPIGVMGLLTESLQPAMLSLSVKTALFDPDESPIELVYEHARGGMSWEFSTEEALQFEQCLESLLSSTGFKNEPEIMVLDWLRCKSDQNRIQFWLGTGEMNGSVPESWFLMDLEYAQGLEIKAMVKQAVQAASEIEFYIFKLPEPGLIEIGRFVVSARDKKVSD